MDILSKHKVGSDLPTHEKQRNPIYKTKNKTKSFTMEKGQIDNISRYVEKNLKGVRGKEHR